MSRLQRIAFVTGGLAIAGAVTGAASAGFALSIMVVLLLRGAPPWDLVAPASAIGAGFGALVAPSLAWIALRRVSIARAISAVSLGSGVGGAIGVALGASLVNPYESFSLLRAPVPQGVIGALAGAIAAALLVRWRYGQVTIPDRAV
jgi:hypothetical protein